MSNLSEEEKKAIELLKEEPDFSLRYYERENAIDIVLNLIEKQEKAIDEMAKAVYDYANLGTMGICPAEIENGCINFDLCEYFGKKDINCLKCVKQYFYKEVDNNE